MTSVPHSGAKSVTPGGSVAGRGQVVSDQCRVVAHFARAIATVFDDKAAVAVLGEARALWPMWTEQSDDLIEQLGNILNGMDAVTDEDAWTFPIVKASVARRSAKATAGETRNAEPIHRRDGDEG